MLVVARFLRLCLYLVASANLGIQLASQSINLPASLLLGLVGRLVVCLVGWFVGSSFACSTRRSVRGLVGRLVGCSVGGFFGCLVDGWDCFCCPSVSLLVVGLVGGRGWRHDASLVGWLLATPMVLVASANLGVQLASQSINIRTR